MSVITPAPETQPPSKSKTDLDDRIAAVSRLERLDGEDVPSIFRDLAADMLRDAEEVRYQFDIGHFYGQLDERSPVRKTKQTTPQTLRALLTKNGQRLF